MIAQFFATNFGWSPSYPLPHKSQVYHALGLLFAREGVPSKMIVDGVKEMRLGEFAQKYKGTKPYSVQSCSTKYEIQETDMVTCTQADVVLCTEVKILCLLACCT